MLTVVGVVVVVAIVLVVCSVRRRRRKYDLGCNGTYEVPFDAYIGKFSEHQHTILLFDLVSMHISLCGIANTCTV